MMLGEHFVRCEGILRRLKRGTCEVPDLYNLLGWPVRRDLRYGNMPDGLLTNGNARLFLPWALEHGMTQADCYEFERAWARTALEEL